MNQLQTWNRFLLNFEMLIQLTRACFKFSYSFSSLQDASLQLSAVNLPGGELRRRSIEDELMMREYLSEGDLISAEVQKVSTEDGLIHLHTRSLNYGKFGQKLIIKFKPYNIKISAYDYYSVTKFLKPE